MRHQTGNISHAKHSFLFHFQNELTKNPIVIAVNNLNGSDRYLAMEPDIEINSRGFNVFDSTLKPAPAEIAIGQWRVTDGQQGETVVMARDHVGEIAFLKTFIS